jgi:hypothetical protein
MVRALELAIEALRNLPASDQERIGRQVLTYVEKLQRLRIDIAQGASALDEQAGVPLDIDDFLRRQNERHVRT